ncbi:fiber protein [Enterobacter sp. BIGb0383]|uniref:tail fiber protein n=1 Tax=unclassified Enterobacter TaxID=2608935 RepID=UPI000F49BCC9|nr:MULTISPECIES: tail fiber protein [unclassified Enterobacter]ROP62289.1 fiber protein [Enterobacter sp. BIGb0383]ROS12450.1 fiber protein [Enterobacter sp. BIGb0359]
MADSNDKKTTVSKAKKSTVTKAKTTAVKKTVLTQASVLTQSDLPTADALKLRFKAGSIPLQSDFADLIDMANAGASAAGLASGQTRAGQGMRISDSGLLEPDITSYNFKNDPVGCSPVMVNTDTNQIVVDLDNGLVQDSSGLGVKADTGITVSDKGVAVKIKAGSGVTADEDGISIKTGTGIEFDADNVLQLKLDSDYSDPDFAPLIFKNNRLETDLGSGLVYKSNGICVGAGDGIAVDNDSIRVKAGSGITVDSSGVSVDISAVIPKGMITMFSGSAVPDGWALCNGENGTPDLRDKFIRGASNLESSSGGYNTASFTPQGSVNIGGHALTVNEMPSHNHAIVRSYSSSSLGDNYYPELQKSGDIPGGNSAANTIGYAGNGDKHSHTGTFSGEMTSVDIVPVYFALAFIMKL